MNQLPLERLADAAHHELATHILPYWSSRAVDAVHGGFVGRIDGRDRLVPDAPKGGVLAARLLWTFAASARVLDPTRWRPLADRAFTALHGTFRDRTYGGTYWTVQPDGTPLDSKKQVYAQAFAIYGLAEYVRIGGPAEAMRWALRLYRLLETHAADHRHGGYFEAFSREWGPLEDVRLSDKDDDAPKSMNTHLHILEAYTALYRVWPDPGLAERLYDLVHLFLDRVIDAETGHLIGFFEADWTPRPGADSFGHDIEASWLLDEAIAVLGDDALAKTVRTASLRLARLTLDRGLDADGGLFNERHADGSLDADKHWWPQAEAVVGFLNAYEHTGEAVFADAAVRVWAFIDAAIVDRAGGEWFFRVSREGVPYREEDKVGLWKCPYHNARACLEVIERVGTLHPA